MPNPHGYLITFRAHGTWLHGDERGSIDRLHNRYGTPYIPPDARWHRYNEQTMKLGPTHLNSMRRTAIADAIKRLVSSGNGSCTPITCALITSMLSFKRCVIPKSCYAHSKQTLHER
ncbi:MAG TPA: hypothetical protein VLB46_19900 [Pyrinomonadaceae bacterium]|nr:hypothetical protein [Pyrinomonadaceae bacterium]